MFTIKHKTDPNCVQSCKKCLHALILRMLEAHFQTTKIYLGPNSYNVIFKPLGLFTPQTFIAFVLRHKNPLGRTKIMILTFIGLIDEPDVSLKLNRFNWKTSKSNCIKPPMNFSSLAVWKILGL